MRAPLNNHETINPITTESRYRCRIVLSVSLCHSEAAFIPVIHFAKYTGDPGWEKESSADKDGIDFSSDKSSGYIFGMSHTELITIPSGAPSIRDLAVDRKLPAIELLNVSVMKSTNIIREGAVTREKKATRDNVRTARAYSNLFTE